MKKSYYAAAALSLFLLSGCIAGFSSRVEMLPVNGTEPTTLQTTIYQPEGSGPFPLAVLNHGRIIGPAGGRPNQKREEFQAAAAELTRLGYLVAIPMRRGYAGSGGKSLNFGCDMRAVALNEAADIKDALDALVTRPDVDRTNILLVGQSVGGLAVTAFSGQYPEYPGVKGIINFAGGQSRDNCNWAASEINAHASFGKTARVPMLWLYGTNDSFWGPSSGVPTQFYDAYTANGASVTFIQFGNFGVDAHGLLAHANGKQVWLPPVLDYLKARGLPAKH